MSLQATRIRAIGLVAAAALTLPLAMLPGVSDAQGSEADSQAKLVLLISIDQLRRDRLDPRLPGALGRLARDGRIYTKALLDHAMTETCPGHVSMATGRHPGPAGAPGNAHIDPETGNRTYCVFDAADDALEIGGELRRSPRKIHATAFGDWLKDAHPAAKVFSVSAKDRAAIALGGHKADAAYWLRRTGEPGFTTSPYYRKTLPDWVLAFNGKSPPADGFLKNLPDEWAHAKDTATLAPRPDPFDGENEDQSNVSPHPVRDDNVDVFVKRMMVTPFLDRLTLDFAVKLAKQEELGSRDGMTGPDLLAVSLSGTDYIGHTYGPYSHESTDALRRLDEDLEKAIAALESQVGRGNLLIALTSDHGVLPLPEWLSAGKEETCPVEGGRIGVTMLFAKALWGIYAEVGPWYKSPADLIEFAGTHMSVRRDVAREREISVQTALDVLVERLEADASIRKVWTHEEIRSGDSDWARLYRNSLDPERTGDLVIQFEEGCLPSFKDAGTTHGSPYLYDRAVPMVFSGPGVTPGRIDGDAFTVDLAPSLAGLLGIPTPSKLDGRDLGLGR